MKIKRLGVAEWQRLQRLRMAALADAPEAFDSTLELAAAYSEPDWRQQLAQLATFCAVEGGRDIGMVRGVQADEDASCAFLISMWVAPAARGSGAGEALIGAVVAWAKAAGYRALALDVADTNAPAIALYQRLGFTANGVTGHLAAPRTHITEHRRVLALAESSLGVNQS